MSRRKKPVDNMENHIAKKTFNSYAKDIIL